MAGGSAFRVIYQHLNSSDLLIGFLLYLSKITTPIHLIRYIIFKNNIRIKPCRQVDIYVLNIMIKYKDHRRLDTVCALTLRSIAIILAM